METAKILLAFCINVIVLWNFSDTTYLGASSCSGETSSMGIIIYCKGQSLTEVPLFKIDNPDMTYYELTLENNGITEIKSNAFRGLKFSRLILTGNKLVTLANDSFVGLENSITELYLELDSAAEFPVSALQPLSRLQILEIKGFSKQSLPSRALANLVNLKNLSLSHGSLKSINPQDFEMQKSSLINLNLQLNAFTDVPTSTLISLSQLTSVNLQANQIGLVQANAFGFGVSTTLIEIILSQNPITSIHQYAFQGLENCLQKLSLHHCHLIDSHLESIKSLRLLRELDIQGNTITSIDTLFKNMNSLQKLSAGENQIKTLSRAMYKNSNSIQILSLEGNKLVNIAPDTFTDLSQLQELNLDGALALQLDSNSFRSQQNTLRVLSMKNCNLTWSQWSTINNLSALQTLYLSSSQLSNIPDFTFQTSRQLNTLDLSNNLISNITQRSLTGLERSLQRFYISNNQLTTLDECVFYKFEKIELLQMQLKNNPLICDCNMKWLYTKIRWYLSKDDTKFLASQLPWTCANLENMKFVDLTDNNFKDCLPTTTKCEELMVTTPEMPIPDSTPSSDAKIQLQIIGKTSHSFEVGWTPFDESITSGFNLNCSSISNTDLKTFQKLPSDVREYTLTELIPDTLYTVCVDMLTANATFTTCVMEETESIPGLNMPVILGASIGGGLGIIVILIAAICMCIAIRKSRRRSKIPIIAPKVGQQSKRFIKHTDSTTLDMTNNSEDVTNSTIMAPNSPNDVIKQTLETMSEEEKDRLVNLLTGSRGSLNELDRPMYNSGSKYNTGPKYFKMTSIDQNKHIYEEIPDQYYDEIPNN